jgi:hypothetical protein
MVTIAEASKNYEMGKMANITELQRISTSVQVGEKTFKEGTAEEFRVLTVTVDGKLYRLPSSVLANLKVLLEERPTLKTFKVRADGSGMNTRYTVIPLE